MVKRRPTHRGQSHQTQTPHSRSKQLRRSHVRLLKSTRISKTGDFASDGIPGVIRDKWKVGESVEGNLKRLGLCGVVNRGECRGVVEKQDVVVETLEKYANVGEVKREPKISRGEDAALGRMIAKHGDDYEKMARDISLNYLQWTATKLRKKCERRNKIKKMEKRL